MTRHNDNPRIYVACLASYNAGTLHGTWIECAGKTGDEIHGEVQAMLASSPEPGAEEWAIHDYEGFLGIRLAEWEPLDRVAALATGIEEYGEAFAFYAKNMGTGNLTDIDARFRDAYMGEWYSLEEYAAEMLDDLYEIPEYLSNYIDYHTFARDLLASGEYWTEPATGGGVHVFRSF